MENCLPLFFGFIGTPGPGEMMILLALGVLLFGRRLPEVGRQLGRSIIEFKKGIHDGGDDNGSGESSRPSSSATKEKSAAEKFDIQE